MALTPLTYDILLALSDGPLHGYGIIKDIEERSGVDAAPSTGALYLALRRMLTDAMIEEDPNPPADADQRRRYCRITTEGREEAGAESRRLATLVAAARKKKLLSEGTA
jgi:DNA-binding PadR family transcriptional regulator